MIGKLLLLVFLVILGVSLAIAAIEVLGWIVGGSAVLLGTLAAAYKISQDRAGPGPSTTGSEPSEWTPRPRTRDPADPE